MRAALLVLVGVGVLSGCGGGAKIADNKEAAAAAAFAASRGANSAHGMYRALQQPIVGMSTTVDCPNGGTVAVGLTTLAGGTGASVGYELTYNNCNYDSANSLSGTMTLAMNVSSGETTGIALTMKGRVTFSGETSDFVDMDLTQTVDITRLSETSGTVSVVLDGTVTTSSNTYTYSQETLVITADGIPHAEG